MNPTRRAGSPPAIAMPARLLPAGLALTLLLTAGPARPDSPGSALNPYPLPGTQTSIARLPPAAESEHRAVHRGTFQAKLYALPAVALPPGADIRLSVDGTPGAPGLAGAGATPDGRDVYAGNGLKLGLEPSWDLEVEDQYVRLNDDANPAAWGRARGEYWATVFGIEVRF